MFVIRKCHIDVNRFIHPFYLSCGVVVVCQLPYKNFYE